MSSSAQSSTTGSQQQPEWLNNLKSLPATPDKIPAFFFAHGSPMLAVPENMTSAFGGPFADYMGRSGPLGQFLQEFGPALLEKYKPKGIVVFSAHWETHRERLGELFAADQFSDCVLGIRS
jgi:aromatic ring-opening dioxygenase catalytic subunit (LigB family)